MRYIKDFKSMLERDFLDNETMNAIHNSYQNGELNHEKEVERLNSDLASLNSRELEIVERVLKTMTKLSCIKELYKMKVTLNVLKNQNGEDKYVQARGAISIVKGRRIQVAQYVELQGFKKDNSSDEDLKRLIKDPIFKQLARDSVIKKIEPDLKSMNGL
jgi:hypothetical protein